MISLPAQPQFAVLLRSDAGPLCSHKLQAQAWVLWR
jgi:hypothetical protein